MHQTCVCPSGRRHHSSAEGSHICVAIFANTCNILHITSKIRHYGLFQEDVGLINEEWAVTVTLYDEAVCNLGGNKTNRYLVFVGLDDYVPHFNLKNINSQKLWSLFLISFLESGNHRMKSSILFLTLVSHGFLQSLRSSKHHVSPYSERKQVWSSVCFSSRTVIW